MKLKNLSQIEAEPKINRESVDVSRLLREAYGKYEKAIEKQRINVNFAVAPDLPCVSGDKEQLYEILDNLIQNAIEASDPGQTVLVRSNRGGLECRVEVQDQGPGIRPEHLPKMFVPFFTTKEKGTGLGLAACKKIMRDLGGDIQVTSTGVEGSTFTLTIPREKEI